MKTVFTATTRLCVDPFFEDRVAPRHQWQLPDGVDRCVGMLQPARTTTDGVSYMASCRTAMNRDSVAISSRVCGRWNRMTVLPMASFQRSLATFVAW